MPGGLLTDLYELNMAASYLRRGMGAPATFSLYVRELPPERGFLVAAGLEACLTFLETFSFDEDDLSFLASIGFNTETLDRVRSLRFEGDVWAVPEGRIFHANEPVLEVTAPIAAAQLVETALLNQITLHVTVASKAARYRIAAGQADLVDFAFRRSHGPDAAMAVARASAIVGFVATSNVEAARRYGLRASGTMAHSYVEAFPTEREAFEAFAADFPERTTFLVDTYDTLHGVATAIDVIRDRELKGILGVRLDSGDLESLARDARRMLDDAGLVDVRIVASGGLHEERVAALVRGGAPLDAFGIGTQLGVSADAPYVDSVYKLVSFDGRPVLKLSANKATRPGAKQVFRGSTGDHLGLRDEPTPAEAETLLEPVMLGGRRVAEPDTIEAMRTRFDVDLAALPAGARRLHRPEPVEAAVTPAVKELTERTRDDARRQAGVVG